MAQQTKKKRRRTTIETRLYRFSQRFHASKWLLATILVLMILSSVGSTPIPTLQATNGISGTVLPERMLTTRVKMEESRLFLLT